jgi:ABC-type glycerol-3-phosphate transport system permease component
MQAMEFLSWIQTLIYPNGWTFTGLASFFDQLLSLDRLYISRMNVLSFRGIFEVFRTSFLDNIVAPGVEPKSFISFSRSWFNLTFTHRLSAIYAITVSCFLGFGLAFLYALVSKRAYIDVEVQLAFAFIVVACGIALVFRSLGVPLIFAVHVVFPLVYLGLRGYILLEWRHKRTLMAVFIALLVLNNAAFISDVNLHLREANGLGVEYPAD